MRSMHYSEVPYYKDVDLGSAPNELVRVICDDGTKVANLHDLFLCRIMWEPLLKRKMDILKEDIYDVFPPTKSMCAKIQSKQYKRIRDADRSEGFMEVIMDLWLAMTGIKYWAFADLGNYVQSIDIIDIIETLESPELDDVIRKPLDVNNGLRRADRELNKRGDKLIKLLSTPGALSCNHLLPFMRTGSLKNDQIRQLFGAYGLRADIDDRVLPHVMQCNGVSGMRNFHDLATESASAKKSTYFNDTIIRDSQTEHKNAKLYACNLTERYEGHCGSERRLKHVIGAQHIDNYLDKDVFLDGKHYVITDDNKLDFVEKDLEIVSSIYCNHKDGVCEVCAGRGIAHPWEYIPPVKLCSYVVSVIYQIFSQKVLSTKHLIIVVLLMLVLTKKARKWLIPDMVSDDTSCTSKWVTKFNPEMEGELKNSYLIVSDDNLSHIVDVRNPDMDPANFGTLKSFAITDHADTNRVLSQISESEMEVIFSQDFFEYIRENLHRVVLASKSRKKGNYFIPLDKWDMSKPVFEVIDANDDMVSFIRKLSATFGASITEYDNIDTVVQDITNFIYSKASVNFFFIEVFIKAIINGVVPNDGNMTLPSMEQGIGTRNIAPQFGYGYLPSYLQKASTYTEDREYCMYDALMGWFIPDE